MRALENVGPMLKMFWETGPALLIGSCVARLCRAVLPVATLYIAKLIIDAAIRARHPGMSGGAYIWKLVLIEFALAIASDLLGRAASVTDSLLGDRFTNLISVRMMTHAAKLDLLHFENAEFYDKLERARRQTTSRMQLMSQLLSAIQDLVTLILFTSALLVFSPLLLLLLLCAVLPSFLGETHFASLSYSLLYRWTPQRRELDYLRWLGSAHESAKEIKVFGLGHYLVERYRKLAERFDEENRHIVVRRAIAGSLLALLGTAGYYAAYGVILYRTIHGLLTIGDLTFLARSFGRSRSLIESVLSSVSSVSEQALNLDDLFDFFRMEPGIRSLPGALAIPNPLLLGLEFRQVSFRYPGAQHDALRNVNFLLRPGERMALIGENGAGKTTITKLIARLYDPSSGQILLDGIDLREYDVEEWQRQVGIIFQDFMRYNMLIRENIGLGQVDSLNDLDRVRRAAQLSLASDVAGRFEKGLDQMIGSRFEEGVDLSGGEWQKVALGRAYMRDAQLLILDEPTATLDARAEHRVFLRFADLTRDRTAVLISHRFSTVRMADYILVLHDGEVRERGTHTELLALRRRYADLFELQAAGYR